MEINQIKMTKRQNYSDDEKSLECRSPPCYWVDFDENLNYNLF